MKKHPKEAAAPEPGVRPPEYVIELWVAPELLERRQSTARASHPEPGRQAKAPRREADPKLADWEAEP
jgi:hypothetical protein